VKNKDIKKLDKLWSLIIKTRAGFICEYCGERSYLNSHHIFSRSNKTLRWDVDNGICLCAKHHMLGNFSAHKSPIEFGEWIRKKRGEEWYQDLLTKSHKISKNISEDEVFNDLNDTMAGIEITNQRKEQ
jgi:hypothetical protein